VRASSFDVNEEALNLGRKEVRDLGKNRFLSVSLVVLIALVFLVVGALNASEKKAQEVPKELKIENEGYPADKKGGVSFSHEKHVKEYKAACTDCHHEIKDGQNVWKEGDFVKKCSECHDLAQKQGKVMKLQNAYHRNCKNCHKAYLAEHPDSKAPYKKCNDCHEKKT
jgi:hypothetical protein